MAHFPKTARFELRLTERDAELLERLASAAGLTKSAFFLSLLRGRTPFLSLDREALRAARLELARQGNNLNQIAHSLNAHGRTDPFYARLVANEIAASQQERVAAYRAVQDALSWERTG